MCTLVDIALAGDLVLDEPDARHWLSGIAPRLLESDLAIAHLEVAHTNSLHEMAGDVPAPGAPPENLAALADAGIDMVSLAGNHIADSGAQGIADTIAGLSEAGVLYAGAGIDLPSARLAAITCVKGLRIALLSYNCVGPQESWAAPDQAGCSFLPLGTADGSPVNPRADITEVLPAALDILREDIAIARNQADFVIVALHKGIVHTPVTLAPYERPIAHAAVDLGADAVVSHHAHIVRGVEFHGGKPIFHGLGNGCVVTSALSPDQDHAGRAEWAQRRKQMFGFEPDPAYSLAPFHPEAVNAFIARLLITDDGVVRAGVTPVHVEPPGRPVLADGERAREIADYIEQISREAGLPPISIDQDFMIMEAA
ncbi:CapA family protein [Altericroceibacterium endophyticum]|uniref:CapA family protein n=1 Tax=Altericroceibacterium endophyticum TaxID=1808508 RepID=A0A6I4T6C7_9SPHN|nr:CapA family protein [Altericroceibacterium endophyticum]MXO66754.1 CapA family protein [Altericroceibacterium endophyticum]